LRSFGESLTAGTIDDALVMVSELVTNAVQHGKPDVTLRFWLRSDRLTVAVTDRGGGTVPRTNRVPGRDQQSGRGLLIVDALAARWGVSRTDRAAGKTVWFDLAAPRHTRNRPSARRTMD